MTEQGIDLTDMSSRNRGLRFTRFLVHHYVELITGLAVLFILQTGLVPFDFGAEAGPHGSAELFGRTVSDFTYADVISNIFLYVPVGLLLHWSFYRRVRNTIAALLLAIAAAAALSGGVEFLQTYASSRFSSIIDFTCNLLGACVGALISLRCRLIIPAFLRAIAWEFQEQPQVAIIKAYVCVLVIVAAMPFSFSLDTTVFKKSLKTVTLVPFGAMTTARAECDAACAAENSLQYGYAKWRELKCWSRWAVELAAFAALA